MSLTAGEQYLLELINRGRLDPAAEAARYGLDLNAGLDAGTITTSAKQVLAPSASLHNAAARHSNWMLDNDVFSHTGQGNSNAGARMQSAGYEFTGSWAWRENLAWVGSTGAINLDASISQHHKGLYLSESHRVNTFAEGMQEVGLGQVSGRYTYNGSTYNSSMLTEKFAVSGSGAYVTGVAYRDKDADGFYSIGEGQSGIWVRSGSNGDTTEAAGGYAVSVGMQKDLNVQIGTGNATMAVLQVDTRDGNVKLDAVAQNNGSWILELSGSANLQSGIGDAELLGNGDLDLSGHGGANKLWGNDGDNIISGRGGSDLIWGGGGNDWLIGGEGNDALAGGAGSDQLAGNNGVDRLYGQGGSDRIMAGHGMDTVYGGAARDVIFGQGGNDRIWGEGGNDALYGNAGSDVLYGGQDGDLLDGGAGNDIMFGGAGADLFVFSGGQDRVADFVDDVDTLFIRSFVSRDSHLTVQDVLDVGRIQGGDAVFDFGQGHVLTVQNISDLDILANDLIII